MTSKKLERIRAIVPFPVYISVLVFVLSVPVVLLSIFFNTGIFAFLPPQLLVTLFSSLMVSILGAAGTFLLYGSLAMLGFVSGYRSFKYTWHKINEHEVERIVDRAKYLLESAGFEIYWFAKDTGFVGVKGMEKESETLIHKGDNFPVRAYFRINKFSGGFYRADIKLENRTVVVWDTGEKRHLENLGKNLLHDDPLIAESIV